MTQAIIRAIATLAKLYIYYFRAEWHKFSRDTSALSVQDMVLRVLDLKYRTELRNPENPGGCHLVIEPIGIELILARSVIWFLMSHFGTLGTLGLREVLARSVILPQRCPKMWHQKSNYTTCENQLNTNRLRDQRALPRHCTLYSLPITISILINVKKLIYMDIKWRRNFIESPWYSS